MRWLAVLILGFLPLSVRAGEITVFAASSLVDALTEVAADWQARTGHEARLSFASTSVLAMQIRRGAPADIFLAADPEWMDTVSGRVGERVDLLGNSLVLIAHGAGQDSAAPVSPSALAGLGDAPLAMALTEAVPAGRYGRAALDHLGLWEGLRVAEAANVRAALALVASGAVPMGVVYGSDAAVSEEVHVIGIFADQTHPPILYPAALLTGGAGDAAAAQSFFEALQSPEAMAVFGAHGFAAK